MTLSHAASCISSLGFALLTAMVHAEIAPSEMVAPKVQVSGGNVILTVRPSVEGRRCKLEYSGTLGIGTWQDPGVTRVGDGNDLVISTPYNPGMPLRFYRLVLDGPPAAAPTPAGFEHIPAGEFQMGNALSASGDGWSEELPVHTVQVSGFYMGKYEVTWLEWRTVRDWAVTHGYTDLSGRGSGKADTHPVQAITWWEMVKWCNARTEYENATKGTSLTPCYYTDTAQTLVFRTGTNSPNGIDNARVKWTASGYRLPTEAEWEKAARGGLSGKRFPWGDTINQSQGNYYGDPSSFTYDDGPAGYNPIGSIGGTNPATSPVGSFTANGYGLYDMAGNVFEWCWDWSGNYATGAQTDPRGATSGSYRVLRGGYWSDIAIVCRVAYRYYGGPTNSYYGIGFRVARSSVP